MSPPKVQPANPTQNSESEPCWFIYIIESDDGLLYTGITNDLPRRWKQHSGAKSGAKFFRGRKPACLRFVEMAANRSLASQREAAIKKLSRTQKLALISTQNSNDLYKQHLTPPE